MVANIKNAILRGVSISGTNLSPGVFTQQFSSLAPPGPQVPITGLTFSQTVPPPGPYEFYDPFNNEVGYSLLNARLIDGIVGGTTVTIPLNFPSGYVWTDGQQGIPLNGGTGTTARANLQIFGNVLFSILISDSGSGYTAGDHLTVNTSDVGGVGSGIIIQVDSVDGGGAITALSIFNAGSGYIDGPYNFQPNPSDTVSAGAATIISGAQPYTVAIPQEFNMPTGMFLEFSFDAPTLLSAVVIDINLGFTGLSVVAGPDGASVPDMNGFYPARINAGGFNGYTGSGGYKYADGSYTSVSLTNGTGAGAIANITVLGGSVTLVTITNPGSGYTAGDILSASDADLGAAGGSLFGVFVNTVDGFGVILSLGALTDGTPLTPNPLDMWDTASASFSTDAYYTSVNQDWRNVVIRIELSSSTLNLFANGSPLVQKVPRFTPQLFASAIYTLGTSNYLWSTDSGSVNIFSSGSVDPVTINYVQVGAL